MLYPASPSTIARLPSFLIVNEGGEKDAEATMPHFPVRAARPKVVNQHCSFRYRFGNTSQMTNDFHLSSSVRVRWVGSHHDGRCQRVVQFGRLSRLLDGVCERREPSMTPARARADENGAVPATARFPRRPLRSVRITLASSASSTPAVAYRPVPSVKTEVDNSTPLPRSRGCPGY
jgi:hypothetical protein